MPIISINNDSKTIDFMAGIYRYSAMPWWLAGGISASQVAAVYQPKGALNEVDSMRDLSGNGHHLTKIGNPTWSAATGWNIPTNGNNGYNTSLNFDAVVIRFAGRTIGACAPLISVSQNKLLAAGARVWLSDNGTLAYGTKAVIGRANGLIALKDHNATAGVYGLNFSQESLWLNGVKVAFDSATTSQIHEFTNPKLIGQFYSGGWQTSPVNIIAAAFYKIQPTLDQHTALYRSIMNL